MKHHAARAIWGLALAGAVVAGLAAGLAAHGAGAVVTGAPRQAGAIPDQSTCDERPVGYAAVAVGVWKAQTFVAGFNGRLARVRLPGSNSGGPTTLEVRATDTCGLPQPSSLAAVTITSGSDFTFEQPVLLRQGQVYALVLSHEGGPGTYAWGYSDRDDCYADPRGTSHTSADGVAWGEDVDDLHFATWMIPDDAVPTPAPSPTPRPTPYPMRDQRTCPGPLAESMAVGGEIWYAQVFVPGVTGRLLRVELPGGHVAGTTVLRVRSAYHGPPAGRDLYYAAVRCGSTFDLGEGVELQAGAPYALMLSSDNPATGYLWERAARDDCYPVAGAEPFVSRDGGGSWAPLAGDLRFETIMLPAEATGEPAGPLAPVTCRVIPPFRYLVRDQATCDRPPVAYVKVADPIWKAQTLVAGKTGELRWVDLPATNTSGVTTLHLRATRGYAPFGPDLATATVRCGGRFAFAPGVRVTTGEMYALIVSHTGSAEGFWWGYSGSATCYPFGPATSFTSGDRGGTWSPDQLDIHFATYVLPDDPGGTPIGTLEPVQCGRPAPADGAVSRYGPYAPLVERYGPASRPPARVRRTAYVISLPTGQYDPAHILQKSRALSALLEEATAWHGYEDPGAQPYVHFDLYQDTVFVEPELPPRCAGNYDLGTVFTKHGLCQLIQQGQVDEVWFWEGGFGGLPEWATSGPEWRSLQGTRMPNCGRQVALMALHNGLDLGFALHSFGHRLESTMRVYRPCDFSTATWPWPAVPAGCMDGSASDRTGFVARPFAGNDQIAACGDVHSPPNIADTRGYQYSSEVTVRSICPDWRRDGKATVSEVNCHTWDCSQLGFMRWWFQNVPGLGNTSRDRQGQPMPPWWPYMFGRPDVGTPYPTPTPGPPTATRTPTATFTPSPTPTASRTPSPVPTATPAATDLPFRVVGRSWLPLAMDGVHRAALPTPWRPSTATATPPPTPTAQPVVAYRVPAGTVGNQNDHGGGLGMDFDVVRSIRVTQLGAFDSGQDGVTRPIDVYLVDRRTGAVLARGRLEGSAEPLVDGSRFVTQDEPVVLPAGFQGSIVAEGYGATEPNGNGLGRTPPWTVNDGDGALRFVGGGRYGPPTGGGLPANIDGGPANRYAAGTFVFEVIADGFVPARAAIDAYGSGQ